MVFMLGVLAFFHIAPCIHWLQWFYYTGALFLLLVGIAFISSSLSIFIPDTNSQGAICGYKKAEEADVCQFPPPLNQFSGSDLLSRVYPTQYHQRSQA